MKLGVFTVLYGRLPFEEALDKLAGMGVEAVEVGTGNYPGDAHCKPDELLAEPTRAEAFRRAIEDRGMIISALSQHGNPVHPDAEFRARDRAVWESTVRLAERGWRPSPGMSARLAAALRSVPLGSDPQSRDSRRVGR